MKIELHPEADADAKEAAHWYEDQQIGLGKAFLDRLDEAYRKIKHAPRRFAKLETVKFKAEIRRCLLPRFPYLVIYEMAGDVTHVLAVAHASRRPNYWLKRRKKRS